MLDGTDRTDAEITLDNLAAPIMRHMTSYNAGRRHTAVNAGLGREGVRYQQKLFLHSQQAGLKVSVQLP